MLFRVPSKMQLFLIAFADNINFIYAANPEMCL